MGTVTFPMWLEDMIYNQCGGTRRYEGSMFTSKDWDEEKIKGYLGTYFPRSYGEAYYVFDRTFKILSDEEKKRFSNSTELHILDFCSGTGGQLLGLLDCVERFFEKVTSISVSYIDANPMAYIYLNRILEAWQKEKRSRITIKVEYLVFDIKSICELKVANAWALLQCRKYDFVMTYKGLCEFVNSDPVSVKNFYKEYIERFHKLIKSDGFFVVEDVASYVKQGESERWMDDLICEGLSAADKFEFQSTRNQDWEQKISIEMKEHKPLQTNVIWHILRGEKQWNRHDPFGEEQLGNEKA